MTPNKVAIITGASSGIGAASARLLVADGFRVVLTARRLERLQDLRAEIESQGGQALAITTDVGQVDSINAMVAQVITEYGQVDVLLNNAGFGRTKWLEDLDPQRDIDLQIRVNLLGVIQTTRAVLPHMIERRRGHIINMGSQSSYIGTPTYTIYAASKFGLRGFSEALRREVGVFGIHVSVLYPGGVKTEFAQHMGAQRKTGIKTPDFLALSPEDVGRMVVRITQRPRRGVHMPGFFRLAIWLNYLFPWLNDWIIEHTFTKPERDL